MLHGARTAAQITHREFRNSNSATVAPLAHSRLALNAVVRLYSSTKLQISIDSTQTLAAVTISSAPIVSTHGKLSKLVPGGRENMENRRLLF